MRCEALEKVFASNEIKFEYHAPGDYIFYMDDEEDHTDQHAVKYIYDRETDYLIWDYCQFEKIVEDGKELNIHRWCNDSNSKNSWAYYIDDRGWLHSRMRSVLPDDESTREDICARELENYKTMMFVSMVVIIKDFFQRDFASSKERSENEKEKFDFEYCSDLVSGQQFSPEGNIDDMSEKLQTEINELKMAAAVGEISPEEAEKKISELEQVIKMLGS